MDGMSYAVNILLTSESSNTQELTSHLNITVINYLFSAIVFKVRFRHNHRTISFGMSVITLKCNTLYILMLIKKMPK